MLGEGRREEQMKSMRFMGYALVAAALSMIGCGGSAGDPMAAKSPGMAADAPAAPPAQYPAASEAPQGAPMPGQYGGDGRAMEARKRDAPKEPGDRPGLGTEWGETRFSRISTVPFSRADATTPIATASLFYNDEQGARAMANASGFQRFATGSYSIGNGLATISLRDEGSRFYSGFTAGGRNYIIGEAGRRYTIVVKNNTDVRFEVILSVDGLDVLDGKAAAFNKRGYLVDPHGSIEVDGFRQSTEAVAAFRFSSVRDSYAGQKHGDTRNVGVIGVALFHEKGTNPLWNLQEIQRRQNANPFPGQFATPPGQP